MAVVAFAAQGDEKPALQMLAAVDTDATEARVGPEQTPTHSGGCLAQGPRQGSA
jgi:hypothetical protein